MSQAHRYCLKCWYVLDGLTSPRCPECGRPFDSTNPKTYATQPRQIFQASRMLPILLFALFFLLLEVFCIRFVWETAGEMESGMLSVVVVFGNLVVFASVLVQRPRLTASLLVVLVLIACPVPIYLRVKLSYLETEARRIIAYAEAVRIQTGGYPPDLSGYQFSHQWTSYNFGYTPDGFRLGWWVVQPGVSHWYTPASGFGYYPD